MCLSGLVFLCLLFGYTQSCFRCFIKKDVQTKLCQGLVNPNLCDTTLDTIFNNNNTVIESAKVGSGYEEQLKEKMNAVINDVLKNPKYDNQRLQEAAGYFSAEASKLPRDQGCICGPFVNKDKQYNCATCKYDPCDVNLDCPVKEIITQEYSSITMLCVTPFNFTRGKRERAVWKFAAKINTQDVEDFKEVTAGADFIYSIRYITLQHQGTYQCEIYSTKSYNLVFYIARIYYYLSVTEVDVGYTELEELFDQSIRPEWSLFPVFTRSNLNRPSPMFLTACLSAMLLLLLLTLGALYVSKKCDVPKDEEEDHDQC